MSFSSKMRVYTKANYMSASGKGKIFGKRKVFGAALRRSMASTYRLDQYSTLVSAERHIIVVIMSEVSLYSQFGVSDSFFKNGRGHSLSTRRYTCHILRTQSTLQVYEVKASRIRCQSCPLSLVTGNQ